MEGEGKKVLILGNCIEHLLLGKPFAAHTRELKIHSKWRTVFLLKIFRQLENKKNVLYSKLMIWDLV